MPLLFVACGGGKQSDGERRFFRYNQSAGVSSLDPAFARDQSNIWVTNQLFSGLVQLDNSLNIKPSIAESWEVSDDGLRYTFHLRDDVYFHNHEVFPEGKGRKVTAEDFVFSFNRLIDPATASPGAWIFNGRVSESLPPFEAIDEHTFALNLLAPFPPMMGILTMQYTYVVPKEAIEKYGRDFRKNPVGTGPFKLVSWREGNVLIMERNPEFYEFENDKRLPHLDGIRVSFVESKSAEFMDFLQGNLDFVSGIDAAYVDQMLSSDGNLRNEYEDEIILYKSPYLNTEYLGFLMHELENGKNKSLQNKKVRQAINYAIDREEMVRILRNNIGKPANAGMIPAGLPGYDKEKVKGYTYDPAKAASLLREAGYPEGRGLGEIVLFTNNAYVDLHTAIENQLQKVGIPARLDIVPPAFLREMMSRSEAAFFRGSWIADYPDAESYLTMFYSTHTAPPNYTRFKNERFDSLYRVALFETDIEKRIPLYQEMDRIVIEEAPVVPLYYDEVLRFASPNVKGIEPNPLNLLILKNVYFEDINL
ncbi:MAG: ABC transporter substrate-binding protein [Chitinophagaceae bacterium]|nr:MAG: ABC transporter substrate-binding protein [Chitinophagaceae bacterium]